MVKLCRICGKSFKTILCKIKEGKGKFCSRKCYGISKLGKPSWSSGKKGLCLNTGRTHFKKGDNLNKKNINWKGNSAGYLAIHNWVKRKLNFPKVCNICGKIPKKIELANKDHKYRRNIKDYTPMCTSCHRKYDIKKGFVEDRLKPFRRKKGDPIIPHKRGCKCFRCINHHKFP
jgi:hypothetical protein